MAEKSLAPSEDEPETIIKNADYFNDINRLLAMLDDDEKEIEDDFHLTSIGIKYNQNNPINASEEHSGIDSTQINNRDAFKINSLGYKSSPLPKTKADPIEFADVKRKQSSTLSPISIPENLHTNMQTGHKSSPIAEHIHDSPMKKRRSFKAFGPEDTGIQKSGPEESMKNRSPVRMKKEFVNLPRTYPSPSHNNYAQTEFQFAIPSTPPARSNYHKANPRNDSAPRNTYSRYPPREQEIVTINNEEYRVLKEVGKGSSGKVFQVFSSKHSEFYALKWIEIKREEDTQAIMNEIELMRSLRKENRIVAILDYHATPYAITIIMEFGEIDLAHLIQKQSKRSWNISFIRYYWRQMLECVNTIHHKNILHSDLKPANFILVKGRLKLIDFGIAKKVGDDTTNIYRGIQVGTVNYMSPEALLDVNEGKDDAESLMKLGRPSDVWSLGCILYQMVYGKTPFYHLKLQQKLLCIPNPGYTIPFPSTITHDGDRPPIKIPEMLLQLLKSCLNRKPNLRPLLTELLTHPFASDF